MALISSLSVLGFCGYLILDLAILRRRLALRGMLILAASGVLSSALVLATLNPMPLMSPAIYEWAAWCGLALLLVGALLLAYSVFIEIPHALARADSASPATADSDVSPGVGQSAVNRVVTSGTYALCRHPGVLWLGLFLVGTVLLVNSLEVVYTSVLWMLLDLVVVAIQDVVIFPRVLVGYTAYQRRTPFVIPNRASLSAAFKSYRSTP
ncbi:MAG: hypothetical protein M1434_08525 [Chloroflexi bacterium]|nr:hypothetical protein [Chloroflexota bacterium]